MRLRASTFPVSYLELDEGGFESMREIHEDEHERMVEPSAFRLTSKNIYGWDYIYDAEIGAFCSPQDSQSDIADASSRLGMVHPWNAWDDDVPPREAFQPLVDSFRQLTRLAGPEVGLVETDESSPDCFSPRYPDEARIGELKLYEADLRVWKAKCRIAEFHLEYRWDVDTILQTQFRRAEFVERRAKYLSEVVGPLRKERDKAVKFFQEHYRDHMEL
ncbi:hypothetical protein E2P81_ATG10236 [Venturia nashicola]|nr:hypothetical protein E2P81_ATG10236 [Venturia nashicola]